MKQTLIRILLDDWFAIEVREGVRHLGVGFLLIPWLLLGLYEASVARRGGSSWKEIAGSMTVWFGVAVTILCIPLFAGRLPIESLPVFGWGFMLVLGFVAATWFTARRAEPLGIPKALIGDFCLVMLVAGIAGARLFYVIQYRERIFAGKEGFSLIKAALNFSDGGMVYYGGVILGIPIAIWFCRKRNIPTLVLADIAIPGVFIGLAFGRIGCLMNGCCFGDFCALPWAIQFPPDSPPFNTLVARGFIDETAAASLPLHPTQIYSSINAFILAGLTTIWFRARRQDGEILVLALLTYPVTRFVLELLRNDEPGQFATRFTISQWVSMGLFLSGWVLLFLFKKFPRPLTPLPLKLQEPEKAVTKKTVVRST